VRKSQQRAGQKDEGEEYYGFFHGGEIITFFDIGGVLTKGEGGDMISMSGSGTIYIK
jgi:hypothetical protein